MIRETLTVIRHLQLQQAASFFFFVLVACGRKQEGRVIEIH
jgi:hypothetical protein